MIEETQQGSDGGAGLGVGRRGREMGLLSETLGLSHGASGARTMLGPLFTTRGSVRLLSLGSSLGRSCLCRRADVSRQI